MTLNQTLANSLTNADGSAYAGGTIPYNTPIIIKGGGANGGDRVLVLTSENASKVEIANPDNQVRGVGAVWDFTSQLKNGMLLPDSMSTPKELVFQLTGLSRFREGTELRLGFVNMDAKILGPAVRPRGGARAAPY